MTTNLPATQDEAPAQVEGGGRSMILRAAAE